MKYEIIDRKTGIAKAATKKEVRLLLSFHYGDEQAEAITNQLGEKDSLRNNQYVINCLAN